MSRKTVIYNTLCGVVYTPLRQLGWDFYIFTLVICLPLCADGQEDSPEVSQRRDGDSETGSQADAVERQRQDERRRPALGPRLRQRLHVLRRRRRAGILAQDVRLLGAAPLTPTRVCQRCSFTRT